MSVQTNHYVILGARIPYDNDAYEKYEQYMDSAFNPAVSGFVVLYDGMNGEYIIAGHVLASTCNHSSFDNPIEAKVDDRMKKWVKTDIKSKLGIDCEPTIWVVSHHR